MIDLTDQQRQALDARAGPPTLIDSRTGNTYVLLDAAEYLRLRALVEDEVDMRQVAVLVEQALREEDENDPTLAFYQQKYGRKT